MAVTLSDVARHAGVSLATASRVLNGSDRTPAAGIAERVKAAAVELGYVANAQAQALARAATRLVGLVVHDIADPYFSTIARGVQHSAGEKGRQVLLASSDHGPEAELDAVSAFIAYRTDAIILAGSRSETPDPALTALLAGYIAGGGRVVTLGATDVPGAQHLDLANEAGAFELASALIARGSTRFAILAGPGTLTTARQRAAGFARALGAAQLAPLAVVEGPFTREGGYDAALQCRALLEGAPGAGEAPLCLLAANDVMALGAMTAMRGLGLRVPEDVQIAGFDDIPTLRDHSPALTTYRLPLEQIGHLAAELALAGTAEGPVHVAGEVVLRESAG
ncbi:LacI family DNA-binding transcriptional regulator [Arthrobacter sp. 35W]|uniref:LacI family DNA-binding transcriptional regulator n=1 Tax=Arthrobacter sp. 35W TaxID=1132441 RepID=UPI00041FE76E|nr:LacI family DNA-binding transcriptional regulator [Arthrobacter sp. 35W]